MRHILCLACSLALLSCSSSSVTPVETSPAATSQPEPASFSILSINDVYRIDGLATSGAGGLDRLRSVRAAIEEDHPNLLLLHGGDLLYPSFMSRIFDGSQMIDVLNMLDGDDRSFDDRMFVVPGNHEFDEGSEEDVFGFQEHLNESQFNWLAANIEFQEAMGTRVTADNWLPWKIVDFGSFQVGIFGLTISVSGVEYASFDADLETLKQYATSLSTELRQNGADVVVGLTHLEMGVDQQLLELENGPDLIFGGHEHEALMYEYDGKFVFKADADAVTARLVHVGVSPANKPEIEHHLLRIGDIADPAQYEGVEPDTEVSKRIDWWRQRTSAIFCGELDLATDCLGDILAKAGTDLIAEELSIRGEGTNLGNFITDLMAEQGRASDQVPEGADVVAFVNSGSLRLNQNILAEGLVTRQHVEELIQYDGPLFLIRISPQQLEEALGHSAECRISGPWLQVSGIEYTAHVSAGTATSIRVNGSPLGSQDIYAVTAQFIADPDFFGNQDGYKFKTENIVGRLKNSDGSDLMLKDLIYRGIDALPVIDGFRSLAPEVEGRITLNFDTPGTPVCET